MKDRLLHLLLGAVYIFSLSLCSCAGRKLSPTPVAHAQPIARPDTATAPAGVVVQPPRTILDKLTGRTPPVKYYPPGTPVAVGKKSTVSIYNAPATVTTTTVGKKATAATGEGATATAIEKAKAPVATSTGNATDQAGAGAASTIDGNNNAPVLTNTQQEAAGWQAELARGFATPLGKTLAVVLVGFLGYCVWRLWPVLRRKSSTETTA